MKKKLQNLFLLTLALLFSTGAWAEDVTFDFNANEWNHGVTIAFDTPSTNLGNITEPIEKDGVSIIAKQFKASNPPRFYTTNPASNPYLRIVNNHILKVYAPSGKAITKIVFETGTWNMSSATGLDGKTWSGNATMVKFKATGTNVINKMVVTLANKTNETTTPDAETEEVITVDFSDSSTHSEFKDDDSNITEDINVVDRAGSSGESRLYTTIPATTSPSASKNRWYYITSEFTNTLRIFNETMVFKTDPDKIIKSIKMSVKTWNSSNKINDVTVSKSQITAGVDVNADMVEFKLGGQSVIYTITVTLADKPIVLDETKSNVVTAGTYNVALKRDFNANWNTVCLPFAINDIETVFGTGAKAYDFTSYSEGTLGFTAVSELEAGHPYIVYVPAAITDDIVLYNVAISAVNPINTVQGDACFRGTYGPIAAGEWTKTADTDVVYGVTSDGKIQKAGTTAAMKGFRAYFDIPANVEARLSFFDETTGISEMKTMRNVENETFFDLQGRRVAQPTKGLYIVNGKKVVLK